MECLERDSVSQSGHDSRKRRHILHQRGGNPYPHMDVERCQRFRRYGNRQGHTVIVGSRQRIQPVRNNTDRRQLDHGLIVSVRQPVRYRLIRRHKPPECDSITKPSEIHEVERHNNRHHHRIPECGCELIRLMVRKRVGLQPERHDCHSGGQWQHFIPQLYLYGKLRRKIRPCDNPSGWKARRCNHLRVHIHAQSRQR